MRRVNLDGIRGTAIGRSSHNYYTLHKCVDCGKERYIRFIKGKPENLRCLICSAKNPNKKKSYQRGCNWHSWKGGRRKSNGYIAIYIDSSNLYYSMADKKHCILEHRLVMAESLNRCLLRQEHVHHRNGVKTDNRLENLELISPANHNLLQHICANCQLRKEIRMLKWQVKEQFEQIKNLTSKLIGI